MWLTGTTCHATPASDLVTVRVVIMDSHFVVVELVFPKVFISTQAYLINEINDINV